MIFSMHVFLVEVGVYPGELAVILGIMIWLHLVLCSFPVGPWGLASPFPVELRIIAKQKVTAKMWMTYVNRKKRCKNVIVPSELFLSEITDFVAIAPIGLTMFSSLEWWKKAKRSISAPRPIWMKTVSKQDGHTFSSFLSGSYK